MRSRRFIPLLLLPGLIGVTTWTSLACRPGVFDQPLQVSEPLVIGNYVAFLDLTRERVTLVRPARREIRHHDVGHRPRALLASPDQRFVLVLSRGSAVDSSAEDLRPPQLHVIDLDNNSQEAFDLDAPFDELAVSDDGAYAVAYFSASAQHDKSEVFRNPNSIAIVNLQRSTVVIKTVRSFGALPTAVAFSPSSMAPLNADGGLGHSRVLAAVLAQGYLTLVDLAHPERSEVTIRLALPGADVEIEPREIVFAPQAGAAYVMAAGSDDIYLLSLTSRVPRTTSQNDFTVSVSSLAAGTEPSDLALFEDRGRQKVLVANRGSADLSVVDTATAQFVNIPVGTPIDRILVYPPRDPKIALVYCLARPHSAVYIVRLNELDSVLGRNITTLEGDAPIGMLTLIPGHARALAVHTHGPTVMSVVDFDERAMFPMTGQGEMSSVAITANGAKLAGAIENNPQLGIIDLYGLGTRTVPLEFPPKEVLTLRPSSQATDDDEPSLIVVTHDSLLGLMTVVTQTNTPAEQGTFVIKGYFTAGLLNERYAEGS